MGFDNESVINIQSQPGEYFCPVCRQLVYPNEAIQTQCTHLYCKPCLNYVLSTTRACPYDNYLVTDADSKPLLESNPDLAETIGRVVVHCLYHKSGCSWQGPLSESITHGHSCPYGSSPVVCNRCGIHIVHRQVQEHAQNCPGTQAQAQQVQDAAQKTQAAGAHNQNQGAQPIQASGHQGPSQVQSQPAQPPGTQAAVPLQGAVQSSTANQWYHQQYQQHYYQQYPPYDQYQQQQQGQYHQYGQYQQEGQAALQASEVPVQSQVPRMPLQPQSQAQAPQAHLQPQAQSQVPLAQCQVQAQGQPSQQTPVQSSPQNQSHIHSQQAHHQQQTAHPSSYMHESHLMPQTVPNQAQQTLIQQPIATQPHHNGVQSTPASQHLQLHPPQQIETTQEPVHAQHSAMHSNMSQYQQPHAQLPHQHQPMVQQQMMAQHVPPQVALGNQGPSQLLPQQLQAAYHSQSSQIQARPQLQPPVQQHFPSQTTHGQQQMISSQSMSTPVQHPYQQGLPQQHPQRGAEVSYVQQGNRPINQNEGFAQPPSQQRQGKPSHSAYSEGTYPPNSFQNVANHGPAAKQPFMQYHDHGPNVQLQQHQPHGAPVHPSNQPSTLSSSSGTLISSNSENLPQISMQNKTVKSTVLPEEKDYQSVKDVQACKANDNKGGEISGDFSKGESFRHEGNHIDVKSSVPDKVADDNMESKISSTSQITDLSSKLNPNKDSDPEKQKRSVQSSSLQSVEAEGASKTLSIKGTGDLDEKLSVSIDARIQPGGGSQEELSQHNQPSHMQGVSASQNVKYQIPEIHGTDEKRTAMEIPENGFWEDGNTMYHSSHSRTGNFKHSLQQGDSNQGLDRGDFKPHQGLVEAQDRKATYPSHHGQSQGQDKIPNQQGYFLARNVMQPPSLGPSNIRKRSWQHPHGIDMGQVQDKSSQYAPHYGLIDGRLKNLQQSSHPERVLQQQFPTESHVQIHSNFNQPPHQGYGADQVQDGSTQYASQHGLIHEHEKPLQKTPRHEHEGQQQFPANPQILQHNLFNQPPQKGQQLPYGSQSSVPEKSFPQPCSGQSNSSMIEQGHNFSSKQGITPMSAVAQLQSKSSSINTNHGRGVGEDQSFTRNIDLSSPNLQSSNLVPMSSQTNTMSRFPSSLPVIPQQQSPLDGPQSFMEKGLHVGQSMQQPSTLNPVDHTGIMGNKRSDLIGKSPNEHLGSSIYSVRQPSGFQSNANNSNEGDRKTMFEGFRGGSSFPPLSGDGSLKTIHQDSLRQASQKMEFRDNPRNYEPWQSERHLLSDADSLLPNLRNSMVHPMPMSKRDQPLPSSRPLELGSRGLISDSNSKFPVSAFKSQSGSLSKHFSPYQSLNSIPPRTGGPSPFTSDITDGPNLSGVSEDFTGSRRETGSIRSDFLPPRADFSKVRQDHPGPPRSPGRGYVGIHAGRVNLANSFGAGIGGPSQFDGIGRESVEFDGQRNRSGGTHYSTMHSPLHERHLTGVENRLPPFHLSASHRDRQGLFPNHIKMVEQGVPPIHLDGPTRGMPGGVFNKGSMLGDIDSMGLGQKRKPDSTGWCRICHVDCYTVDELEKHAETREHQRKALDLVMSIKRDSAKRQKSFIDDAASQENVRKSNKFSFEGRRSKKN